MGPGNRLDSGTPDGLAHVPQETVRTITKEYWWPLPFFPATWRTSCRGLWSLPDAAHERIKRDAAVDPALLLAVDYFPWRLSVTSSGRTKPVRPP